MIRALVAAFLALALGCSAAPSHKPAIMPTPEIHFVVWGAQDPAPLEKDWTALLGAGVLDRLAEYGVQGGTLGASTTALPDLQPAVFDDTWIVEQLLSQVTTDSANDLYVVVLPPGSSTVALQKANAVGYHFWGLVPYAVVTANEVLISHEVYEAATDPYGLGVRIGSEEVGDLCQGRYATFAGVTVQQVWSRAKGACQ